jgi:MFS family permease
MAQSETSGMPAGVRNAYGFAACNALSFQMVIGSPMILYAKSLDASATVLGLIAGMLPLMNMLQIPAARFVGRVGHKRFVIGGWSVRICFIGLMVLVPLLGKSLGQGGQLAAILALLFFFNTSRGISACGWLPWITSIIPTAVRGRYLTSESGVSNLASFAAFMLAAAVLGRDPGGGQFAALFAFSAFAGVVSLTFLKRIPEDQDPQSLYNSATPVRLSLMLRDTAFRRLLWLTIFWSMSSGGLAAFSVAFLRESTALADGRILLLNSAAFVGGISTLLVLNRWLDRVGSRPVLIGTALFCSLSMLGWISLANGFLAASIPMVLALMFAMGLGGAAVNLAITRLAMATVPEIGRSHYFAVYSVIGSVVLGLSPILWGALVDSLRKVDPLALFGTAWVPFAVLFAGFAACFLLTAVAAWRVQEPESASLDQLLRHAMSRSRLRFWVRLWPRQ